MKNNNFLAISILVSAVILAGALVYAFGPERSIGTPNTEIGGKISLPSLEITLAFDQTLDGKGDVILGDPNAPVEIIEYGDYQCPFCARFFLQTEDKIRENYIATGKVKFIYKDLIVVDGFIPTGHESKDAALAANCAIDQGKFWEYHDALFIVESADGKENNGNLNKELFLSIAEALELDKVEFEACYDSGKYLSEVESDTEEAANDLPRLSTPSSLVNGQLVSGALPYEQFSIVIEGFLE